MTQPTTTTLNLSGNEMMQNIAQFHDYNYCGYFLSGQNRQNLRIYFENPRKPKSKRTKPDFFVTFKKISSFYFKVF
jgi:hypothetical protein